MSFIPYATQSIDETDIQAVREVLTSDWLTQGPTIERFELAFSARHQVAHAVAVSNATAGLHLACLALGVGAHSLVWTSPNSFVASANCALYCNAAVDFVDIDAATRNMCMQALERKLVDAKRSGRLPSVVIPVHFAGLPCDLATLGLLAKQYGFLVIEDASHAVGSSYEGYPIGSRYADCSVFSFHPVKILTTGEGGMVTTPSAATAQMLRLLRSHGITRQAEDFQCDDAMTGGWHYEQQVLGFNYRMTDLQAGLGVSQLKRLDQFYQAREALAGRYDESLANLPLRLPARVPVIGRRASSSWHLYVVEVTPQAGADRLTVFRRMREAGIGVNVHYAPIHLQPYYRKMGFQPGQFPAAEAYARQALSIPLYPKLTYAQQDRVVDVLSKALEK